MSKADTLAEAPAFGTARTARSSRRNAINNAIGGDTDTAAITELPVTVISDNPDNPRNHLRNLDETVETVRELGILVPIVVATVDAYLRDRADRADDLDDGAQYLVVDGHRRLESARRVGLATIPVRVDNARVATDETLLEAAFVANYHRDDMTDLEEAHALQALVDHYGSQTKAAKRLGIPQGTLSTKLSLLKLAPELQKELVTGERKVEHVRNLGKLSPQEQRAKADERAQAARRKADASPPSGPAPAPSPVPTPERQSGPANYHGVIIPADGQNADPAPSAPDGAPHGGGDSVPEQRPHPTGNTAQVQPQPSPPEPSKAPKLFPYDDPGTSVLLCHQKMTHEGFVAHVAEALRVLRREHPDDFQNVIDDVYSQAAQHP